MLFRSVLLGALIFALAVSPGIAGCMDSDNALWLSPTSRGTYDKLMGIMACPIDVDKGTTDQSDAVACNYFVAKALDVLYGIKDFGPDARGTWLTADQIVAYVRSHPKAWSKLGGANDQAVLRDAAAGAANGQPVIATLEGTPHGHVALILGGTLVHSRQWNLDVPNSAAFKLNDVERAYVFCRLSYAFHDPSAVEIYWRVK